MRGAGRWTIGLIVVAVLLAAVAGVSWRIGRETAPDCPPLNVFDGDPLPFVNDYRAANGLAPLTAEPRLTAAAQWMAEDIVANPTSFNSEHIDSLGRDLGQRLTAFGYPSNTYRLENLAQGHISPEAVVAAWIASPSHNANLLDPNVTQSGFGYWAGYWVFDAASVEVSATAQPALPAPVIIPPLPTPNPTPVIIEPTPCGAGS